MQERQEAQLRAGGVAHKCDAARVAAVRRNVVEGPRERVAHLPHLQHVGWVASTQYCNMHMRTSNVDM